MLSLYELCVQSVLSIQHRLGPINSLPIPQTVKQDLNLYFNQNIGRLEGELHFSCSQEKDPFYHPEDMEFDVNLLVLGWSPLEELYCAECQEHVDCCCTQYIDLSLIHISEPTRRS